MQPTSRVVSRGDLRLVCFCSPALSTPPARRPPLAPVNPLPSHSHSRRGGSAAKERCRGHVHMYVHVPRPTGSRQTPCAYACRVLSSRRLPPSNSPRCGRDARMRRSRHWAASQLEPQAAWARHDVAAVARMSCNHGARARAHEGDPPPGSYNRPVREPQFPARRQGVQQLLSHVSMSPVTHISTNWCIAL